MEKIKSFILFTFFLVVTVSVDAQKRFEHNVFASAGLFIDHSRYDNGTGLSVRLGYGLNCYFTDHILMCPWISSIIFPESGKDGPWNLVRYFLLPWIEINIILMQIRNPLLTDRAKLKLFILVCNRASFIRPESFVSV